MKFKLDSAPFERYYIHNVSRAWFWRARSRIRIDKRYERGTSKFSTKIFHLSKSFLSARRARFVRLLEKLDTRSRKSVSRWETAKAFSTSLTNLPFPSLPPSFHLFFLFLDRCLFFSQPLFSNFLVFQLFFLFAASFSKCFNSFFQDSMSGDSRTCSILRRLF